MTEKKRSGWSNLKDVLLLPIDLAVTAWLLPDMIFTLLYQEDGYQRKRKFFRRTLPKWAGGFALASAILVGGAYYLATRSEAETPAIRNPGIEAMPENEPRQENRLNRRYED